MNKQLDFLTEYPFQYLSDLLKDIKKDPLDVIGLHIGEPKERAPMQALDIINENSLSYSKYPTSSGELYLRESYCNYLNERFSISNINPNIHVLPLSGSREGIFSFIQSTIDTTKKNPRVILPNPFYKIYEGAAIMAGAEPFYLNSIESEGFKPDLESIPEDVWEDCQLFIICSPSNPTGYCFDKKEYIELLEKAEKYDFLLCSDECYIDIYDSSSNPPLGLLECDDVTMADSRSVIFHSLSKRSSLAGLRSGFICASEAIIKKLSLYRTYHGVTLSLPTQLASTWAWQDSKHVESNRVEYDKKYKAAISCLDEFDDVKRPDGGFYIWLKLPFDDQAFAKLLYEQESVLSLPGSYLGKNIGDINPGEGFLRLAVVHDVDTINKAFSAVNRTMQSLN